MYIPIHFGKEELLQVPFARHVGFDKLSKTKPPLHRYSNSIGYRFPWFNMKPFFGDSTLGHETPEIKHLKI